MSPTLLAILRSHERHTVNQWNKDRKIIPHNTVSVIDGSKLWATRRDFVDAFTSIRIYGMFPPLTF